MLELDPRPFVAGIKQAEANLKVYEAQKVAAEKEEARYQELVPKGAASKRQLEKAEADVKSLEAQIAASEEEVKRAKLELEYSQIKAEIDGQIGAATLDVGNLVNAGGSDPLLAWSGAPGSSPASAVSQTRRKCCNSQAALVNCL